MPAAEPLAGRGLCGPCPRGSLSCAPDSRSLRLWLRSGSRESSPSRSPGSLPRVSLFPNRGLRFAERPPSVDPFPRYRSADAPGSVLGILGPATAPRPLALLSPAWSRTHRASRGRSPGRGGDGLEGKRGLGPGTGRGGGCPPVPGRQLRSGAPRPAGQSANLAADCHPPPAPIHFMAAQGAPSPPHRAARLRPRPLPAALPGPALSSCEHPGPAFGEVGSQGPASKNPAYRPIGSEPWQPGYAPPHVAGPGPQLGLLHRPEQPSSASGGAGGPASGVVGPGSSPEPSAAVPGERAAVVPGGNAREAAGSPCSDLSAAQVSPIFSTCRCPSLLSFVSVPIFPCLAFLSSPLPPYSCCFLFLLLPLPL